MTRIPLNDETQFALISGLWKGERGNLQPARVLRGTNFAGDGLPDFEDVVEIQVEERHFESRSLKPGDIIIERSGGGPKQPVGRVALFLPPDEQSYFASNFTTAIRVVDRSVFEPEYVALYLQALYWDGATETLQRATTGIRNLDWREYLRFEIPACPLNEQKMLTRLIGGVRAAYRNEARSYTTAFALKQTTMRELFTRGLRGEAQKESEIGFVPESWSVVQIDRVATKTQYGLSIRGNARGQLPILRMNCQVDGRVDFRDLQYVSIDSKTREAFVLRRGDLLFNRTNSIEHVGRMAIFDSDREAVFASYLIRLSVNQDFCDPQFLNYYMNQTSVQRDIKRYASRAVGQANINASKLRTIEFPLPPTLDEQREIVAILDALDRKIDLHKRKKAVLEELFRSLLHKLMTGEIQVSDLDLSALPQEVTA
jgi:type I restriction enzyme S subunit